MRRGEDSREWGGGEERKREIEMEGEEANESKSESESESDFGIPESKNTARYRT